MKEATDTQGIESIFVIVFALLGGAAGWTVGYGLEDAISRPRLLAALAERRACRTVYDSTSKTRVPVVCADTGITGSIDGTVR